MEVLNIIDRFEDEIEQASSFPFSSKRILDKEVLDAFIEEIRVHLPEDVKKAKWVQEERVRMLNEARAERERILAEANDQAGTLVDEHAIVKQAQEQAKRIIEEANLKSINIRSGAKEYVDGVLVELEKLLTQKMQEIEVNRKELKEY